MMAFVLLLAVAAVVAAALWFVPRKNGPVLTVYAGSTCWCSTPRS